MLFHLAKVRNGSISDRNWQAVSPFTKEMHYKIFGDKVLGPVPKDSRAYRRSRLAVSPSESWQSRRPSLQHC